MKILETCALVLVLAAGLHITVNSFLLAHIETHVSQLQIESNRLMDAVDGNMQIIKDNQSHIVDMQAELNRRKSIIEGTADRVEKMTIELQTIEAKLDKQQATTRS